MPRRLLAGLVVILAACSSGTDGSASPSVPTSTPVAARSVSPGPGPDARGVLWGTGTYGVVLVAPTGEQTDLAADWGAVAEALAAHRMSVLALYHTTGDGLSVGIRYLREQGAERVAVIAVGEAAGAFDLGAGDPSFIDQLICISCDGDAAALGEFPKLFVASEGETAAAAATRMANEAAGEWNAELLVPGRASGLALLTSDARAELMDALIRRLEERR